MPFVEVCCLSPDFFLLGHTWWVRDNGGSRDSPRLSRGASCVPRLSCGASCVPVRCRVVVVTASRLWFAVAVGGLLAAPLILVGSSFRAGLLFVTAAAVAAATKPLDPNVVVRG